MEVSAWSSGGPIYGIRIGKDLRDKLFDRNWETVNLFLGKSCEAVQVKITKGFWKKCPELRDKAIKHWFEEADLLEWERGSPPKFKLTVVGEQCFRVQHSSQLQE